MNYVERKIMVEHRNVVVVGQGYVGLPVACGAADAGFKVVGLDLDQSKVDSLNSGKSVVDDLTDCDIRRVLRRGYKATVDTSVYADADIIVICVPTPLKEGRSPDLSAVHSAAQEIAQHIKQDTLVVLESTTYSGTTRNEIAPILESSGFSIGDEIFLAYSPERIDPGNPKYSLANTPKVVGADDATSLHQAASFYSAFVSEVAEVSGTAEAELTKLLENTYRHINIGLVNELAVVCHELGIDVWEVIKAASTKPFGFQAFRPGPGVGGHCIPIDPNYLNHQVRKTLGKPFRFVELAEDINSSMPSYIVKRVQDILNAEGRALRDSKVLLLGVTYKAGIADTRESPSLKVFSTLTEKGAHVVFYDHLVETWQVGVQTTLSRVADLDSAAAEADIVVQLQEGDSYDIDQIAKYAKHAFDTKGVATSALVHKL